MLYFENLERREEEEEVSMWCMGVGTCAMFNL